MKPIQPKTIWRGVVRKQEFDVRDVDAAVRVLNALSSNNHSGPVTVNFSQGGIQNMVAEDRATLPA